MLLFVIGLIFAWARSNADPRLAHWIFVHYHKTGHDLSHKLAGVFMHGSCNVAVQLKSDPRVSVLRQLDTLRASDIAVLAGPDMNGPWNSTLLGGESTTVRLVHFLRNPFDMILSAYLYHSQDNVPEKWLTFTGFDPCAFNPRTTFDQYAKEIGESYGDFMYFIDLISGTIDACHALVPRNGSWKTTSYRDMLRALPPGRGVLLEAARSILSSPGGDILRMATNALYEGETVHGSSYRVYLSDFPVGDEAAFRESAQDLFRFLMEDIPQHKRPFWSCMSVQEAVNRAVELAYVPETAPRTGGHVTQNMINAAERRKLQTVLQDHPAIGPLLDIVSEIVF